MKTLDELMDMVDESRESWSARSLLEDALRELIADAERMRVTMEWYADEARACAKNINNHKSGSAEALMASVTVLAIDGGRRAFEAIAARKG